MMKSLLVPAALFFILSAPLALGADNSVVPMPDPLILAEVDASRVAPLQGYSLTQQEMQYVGKAKKWENISLFMLAGNIASLPIIFAVDDFAGGMVALLTLGGWTISQGMAAFAYRDLDLSLMTSGSSSPPTKTPRFAAIGAAAFGMGAITGTGLIFSDDTGVAIALTAICSTISWISGIVAAVSTHGYAKKVGYSKAAAGEMLRDNPRARLFADLHDDPGTRRSSSAVRVPLGLVTF